MRKWDWSKFLSPLIGLAFGLVVVIPVLAFSQTSTNLEQAGTNLAGTLTALDTVVRTTRTDVYNYAKTQNDALVALKEQMKAKDKYWAEYLGLPEPKE